MLSLTKRQQKIVDAVPACNVVADVGCDHGLVGASLLYSGVAKKVLFCDISEKCLSKAKKLTTDLQIDSSAEFFVQDGLQDLDCDCAVIAGLGGLEITKILSQSKMPQKVVLQPMKGTVVLREFLSKNYKIEIDFLFYDKGKYYNLIVAKKSENLEELTNLELLFGKTNLERLTADFCKFILSEIKLCVDVLSKTKSAETEERLNLLYKVAKICKIEVKE